MATNGLLVVDSFEVTGLCSTMNEMHRNIRLFHCESEIASDNDTIHCSGRISHGCSERIHLSLEYRTTLGIETGDTKFQSRDQSQTYVQLSSLVARSLLYARI